MLTVVCKATFRLLPDESPLSDEQEYPNEDDNYWDDDPDRSLYSPSDLVPFKARADVLLVGQAYAPGKQSVRSLTARLIAGDLDKSIMVFGTRVRMASGQLREGPWFSSMPLRYERAAGGPGNPVGVRSDAPPDAYGNVAVPNLEPPDPPRAAGRIEPIGFGPIAPTWPRRVELLGRHRGSFGPGAWRERPIPEDLDPSYFNAAPRDQQVEALWGDERIVLENLHPQHPRLATRLPGLRPKVTVERERRGAQASEVAVRCDTLWIDTDRSICTLVWRGAIPLEQPDEAGRVVVAMETRSEPFSSAAPSSGRANPAASPDAVAIADEDAKYGDSTVRLESSAPSKLTLPFVKAPPGAASAIFSRPAEAPAARPPAREGDSTLGVVRPAGPAMPFRAVEPGGENRGPASQPEAPADVIAMPAIAKPPMAPPLVQPALVSPPPSGPPPIATSPSPIAATQQSPVVPPQLTQIAKPPPAPIAPPPIIEPPRAPPTPGQTLESAKPLGRPERIEVSAGSALAASNAAAAAEAREGAADRSHAPARRPAVEPRRTGADVVELVWFDPAQLARIRRHPDWKKIIAALKPKAKDDDYDGEPPAEKRKDAKDRREVLGVLRAGDAQGTTGLEEAIESAMEDGGFVPPLVLLAGDLEFPFDELETLKATIAAVSPLATSDKKLKESVDTASELLKTPWLQGAGAGSMTESVTARLRDAFAQSNRSVPAGYLDAHTERMLLQQRHYQKRTVMGQEWIRCLLHPAGDGSSPGKYGAQLPVPTYVPEDISKELPMFQRFRARIIAEARLQLDQYEAQPYALRVMALGRVMAGIKKNA
jgi:hypothetical protein